MMKTNVLGNKEIENKLVEYIRDFVRGKPVIVGLSGGIDSSIVCALAVKALGPKKVKVLIVKNSRYDKEGIEKAKSYVKKLGLEVREVSTEIIRKDAVAELRINEKNVILTSTLDARICDLIIKTISGIEDRIYLGTINGTERLTGWYPKGNLVGDCCPIGGLLKEQEKALAEFIGLSSLIETISKDASKVCSGCGELPEFSGIPYEVLDKVLYIYETSKGDELAKNLKDSRIDPEVYSKILKRIMLVHHKNDVFPNYCKLNLPNGRY